MSISTAIASHKKKKQMKNGEQKVDKKEFLVSVFISRLSYLGPKSPSA